MSTATKLLKPREVTACKKLAESGLSDNKRAAALLAIHQGQTQAQAAVTSGLSVGQVKYIVTRYRKLGMSALAPVAENPVNDKKDKKDKKAKKDKEKNKDKAKKAKKDKKRTRKKNKNKK